MSARPIHAIVVAYHGATRLERCLASLDRRVGVTVVDNSSSIDVRAAAVANGAGYIDAGHNLGFGAGVNVALRALLAGEPREVLLLNPDATLSADALRALADCLELSGNERLAAVSPRLLGVDGRAQRVLWPYPSPLRAWCEAVGLGRLPARRVFAAGAVLLLRWEAVKQVGLFDERFFLYAEEADWQRRAASLGWGSALCSEAVAEHIGSGASTDLRRRETLFHAGQETYVRKWHGTLGWWSYRAAACSGAAARSLVFAGERRAEAARRALLYLRGPRRRALALRDL